MSRLADGPVIPNFGQGSSCERANGWWCTSWLHDHWGDTLQPALVQHVELSVIAVAVGFAIASALALAGFRRRVLDAPFGAFADFLYTIPSLALFQLLVPLTGLTVTTVEIALVSYTLLILYRNMVEGLRAVPEEVLEAARGVGMTRAQRFRRVELPLAAPAIIAGLRLATVSTISIATVAAFVIPQGLGRPIFIALNQDVFKTEILAAGGLAVLLALVADALLVLVQRAATPWSRAR
ncbi:MAG TPA: ABC transporter permease [Gaiellaceae bacterium]|jgi:osmoprotectant transport system permease protein|nr:ABC transporter permease [Gaiellaceae bacterium]